MFSPSAKDGPSGQDIDAKILFKHLSMNAIGIKYLFIDGDVVDSANGLNVTFNGWIEMGAFHGHASIHLPRFLGRGACGIV